MKHILLNNLGSKQSLQFDQLCNIIKQNFYQNTLWKMWPRTYQALFESKEVCMLIWTNFDKWYWLSHIRSLLKKTPFSNRGCTQFFASIKGPGTSFQVAVFIEFFDKTFPFVLWPNFINKLDILPKLFSKIYLFYG